MEYKLYTLVDITHTGQHRQEPGKELQFSKEQNFNTLIQTLGIRSNIWYNTGPLITEIKGRLVGFDTNEIIRVWRFDWATERDHLYLKDDDPVGYLKDDFQAVPYIDNLHEILNQKYAVFITEGSGCNIVFHKKS